MPKHDALAPRPPRGRGRPKRTAAETELTRLAIQQAGRQVMAEHGYHGVSVELILRSAGLSRATFYRYFNNAQEVIELVLQDVNDRLIESVITAVRQAQGPLQKVEAGLLAWRRWGEETGPLLRACLVKTAEHEHYFVLTLHHIVTEGWAMDIFARELSALYEAFVDDRDSPLEPLPVQYLDYSVWQRNWLESGERQRQLDYWTAQLGREHPLLELPGDRPRPPVQSHQGELFRFDLSDDLAARVRAFNAQNGLTLFMTMTATLAVLLYRYSGQTDLRIGAPVANRIGHARARVGGRDVALEANQAGHCLHSGSTGAQGQVWDVVSVTDDSATLGLSLPDGLGGFPGNRRVEARFSLTGRATLRLELYATTDTETLWNATSHGYWTLDGGAEWTGHSLQIAADHWLPTDADDRPTGEIAPDDVHLPGIYVHRIVHNPTPEKRIEKRTTRDRK